ncbi:MAG TPA: hypothetical protein VF469_06380 [Kofleriaceae bacterium]
MPTRYQDAVKLEALRAKVAAGVAAITVAVIPIAMNAAIVNQIAGGTTWSAITSASDELATIAIR